MKPYRTAVCITTLTAIVLLGSTGLAHAQQAQLTRIGLTLSDEGYRPTHNRQTGSLDDGGWTTFSVWLRPGTDYVFRGTCDGDCTDLDLRLEDDNGFLIDSDYAPDDVPEVSVRPRRAGWFHVRVIMASCTIEPCGYAVGTFGR